MASTVTKALTAHRVGLKFCFSLCSVSFVHLLWVLFYCKQTVLSASSLPIISVNCRLYWFGQAQLKLPGSQILALFNKTIRRLHGQLHKAAAKGVEAALPRLKEVLERFLLSEFLEMVTSCQSCTCWRDSRVCY